ncbi:hypothetical protein Syun_010094 [Stephania yunnanensis]|uniref:Uncharacterized protein n=1 Tax=Stephania yunnanensis TaxID=152371 RepID=A0AAP0KIH0_9MAGN
MGNCCARDHHPHHHHHHHHLNVPSSLPTNDDHHGDEASLWGEEEEEDYSTSWSSDHHDQKLSSTASTEMIKIRISRRELEELMGRVEVQRLSVDQMVAHLISLRSRVVHVDDHFDHLHRISWRPALQSIPEVN